MIQALAFWRDLSLARQFALASFVILLVGMASMAAWVAHKIEIGVVHNTGVAAALYMDSFVAPLVQELAESRELAVATREELDRLVEHTPLGEQVLSFKIWLKGGYVVYSSIPSLSGKTFPVTPSLRNAWQGTLHADFDELDDAEDALERRSGLPLLEIYSPIRSGRDGQIIAVSEFYSLAEELDTNLLHAKLQSWLLFGYAGLLMCAALSGIALRGSRTIDAQRLKLEQRVNELSTLRHRLENASRRTTELNEHYLRRIGSDLHDGPSQMIALALLKLDSLRSQVGRPHETGEPDEIAVTHDALSEALTEIRHISAGLAMPEIEGLTLEQLLEKVVGAHERRTDMQVDLLVRRCPGTLPQSILICLYRFVQEILFNAFHHGRATSALVEADYEDGTLEVQVTDTGCGFDTQAVALRGTGLGLSGLRERIESVGGFFTIESAPDHDTRASARFFLADVER